MGRGLCTIAAAIAAFLAGTVLAWSPASAQQPRPNGAGKSPIPPVIEMRVGTSLAAYSTSRTHVVQVGAGES